jgi:hypothetical protein
VRAPPGAAEIADHFGLSQLAPHAGAFEYPLLARCVEGARCTGSTTMYALHASLLDHRGSARAGLTSCCDRCAASLSDPCACSLWQALHGSPMGCSTSHYRRPSHLASHHRHSHHCPRHLHLRLHSSHAWSPHGPHSLPPHLAPLRLSAQTTASPHLSASLHSASSSHATASYYTAALRHEAVP